MCGFYGIVANELDAERYARIVRKGLDAIRHRGPDQKGVYVTPNRDEFAMAVLGHVRLSIIDLAGGRQPMVDDNAKLALAYNGEIYNYKNIREKLENIGYVFKEQSDTEVLLRAYQEWGERCLKYLRGMFAFAIWDGRRKQLMLARDRFGKKPLFWANCGKNIIFASEIKALLSYPDLKVDMDKRAAWEYLSYRYVPGPRTLLHGVFKISPGAYALWRDGELKETIYYHPPDRCAFAANNRTDDPNNGFQQCLEDAVKVRMVSDVPFGAFLSGGIDSSAIVGLMTKCSNTPIKTYSVGFKESEYSELKHAKIVADFFGADHHELVVSEQELMQYLPDLVRFRDAPVSEPSDIPIYLLSKEARRSVKMVLTGEGSDEVLGGYSKHVFERYVYYYQRIPRLLRERLFEPLIYALPYGYRRAKTAITNLGIESVEERYPRWFGALTHREREKLSRWDARSFDNAARLSTMLHPESGNSPLRSILYFDQVSWLPDNLLERGDRMTMAASLEARMPFMDHKLVGYISALPDQYRITGKTTKWILRKIMGRMLPSEILTRPKVGFRVPVNEWFRGPMREYLYDHLTGPNSMTRDFYRIDYLHNILKDHVRGRQNHEKLLWSLLNLEIWSRQYLAGALPKL